MNTNKNIAERIASNYTTTQPSKITQLQKLDKRAKLVPNIVCYTLGIVFSLLLGIGMVLTMKIMGDGQLLYMILGSIAGVIGIAGMSVNYLIYKRLFQLGKIKYGNDIIELAKQIANEENE